MNTKWEITEWLSEEELEFQANELAKQYVAKDYKHTNGNIYTIIDVVTININSTSYWGFVYAKESYKKVAHTRPLYEFLDGRFTLVN